MPNHEQAQSNSALSRADRFELNSNANHIFGTAVYAWVPLPKGSSWTVAAVMANVQGMWVSQNTVWEKRSEAAEAAALLSTDSGVVTDAAALRIVESVRRSELCLRYVKYTPVLRHAEFLSDSRQVPNEIRPLIDDGPDSPFRELPARVVVTLNTRFGGRYWAMTVAETNMGYAPVAIAANHIAHELLWDCGANDLSSLVHFANKFNYLLGVSRLEVVRILGTGRIHFYAADAHVEELMAAEAAGLSECTVAENEAE